MNTGRPAVRVELDDRDLRRGLGQLVVLLVDLVRELLARQAVRRFRAGSLTDAQAERLGDALAELEHLMTELRDLFGVGATGADSGFAWATPRTDPDSDPRRPR